MSIFRMKYIMSKMTNAQLDMLMVALCEREATEDMINTITGGNK